MKIVFIRHTSVDVPPGTCYGNSDVPLKNTFDEEASAVRKNLEKYTFDKVYSSPLSRCRKLAEACGFPSPVLDDRLREMNFGEWEMQRFDSISDPRLTEWYNDYINVAATGGESFLDQQSRLARFLDDLKTESRESDCVAIFAHGGILMNAMVLLGGMNVKDALSKQPSYGGIIEFD